MKRSISILFTMATVVSAIAICQSDVSLEELVDTDRTNPALYNEPDDVAEASAVLAITEVLYGMLRASEGAIGTSVWHYEGLLGEYYVYIWDAGVGSGGFSLVDVTQGVAQSVHNQAPLGHASDIYGLSDLIEGLKEMGYKEVRNPRVDLPSEGNHLAIKRVIEQLPQTPPLWHIMRNVFVIAFPDAMIWWTTHEGGST